MHSDEDYSYDSRYDSYKPPTPSMHGGDENTLPAVGNTMPTDYFYDNNTSVSGASGMGQTMSSTLMTQEALEEKRRKALREKERETAARLRQRELMNQKRDMELKKRIEDEKVRREQEAARLEATRREEEDREKKRLHNQQELDDKARRENEERRRLTQVEKKREQALRQIEMQRLREEEAQRIKRELILRKRKEMERVRDEAERMFALKKKDEMERKMYLVSEMKMKREERLVELEKRRTNPLLMQQEKEFNQLIELQASTGRLATKLEQIQSQREDVRERLLEARHICEMLEIDERQLSISVEEVETDIKKLKGYQEGLSRLVSTRYDTEEYEKAVITIQRIYRGHKSYSLGLRLKKLKEQQELEQAAIKIQKVHRGRIIRRVQKDERSVRSAVKLQCAMRCMLARRSMRQVGFEREKLRSVGGRAAVVQGAWRCHVARRKMLEVREEREALEMRRHHRRHRGRPSEPPPPGAGKEKGQHQAASTKQQQGKTPRGQADKSVNRSGLSSAGGGAKPSVTPRNASTEAAHSSSVNEVSQAPSQAPSKASAARKRPSKAPTRMSGSKGIGGELGRIYMSAPKDKGGSTARGPAGDPRVRRFVPTSATAAVAASAEEAGTFAPLIEDQYDRTRILGDGDTSREAGVSMGLGGVSERMSVND